MAPKDDSAGTLMQSYYLYSTILALKLLALRPLTAIVCNPEMVQRANLSDLRNLTPFWLIAGLYVHTNPDRDTCLTLLRAFVVARFVVVYGYIYGLPKRAVKAAFMISFAVTAFMGANVVYQYRNAF